MTFEIDIELYFEKNKVFDGIPPVRNDSDSEDDDY